MYSAAPTSLRALRLALPLLLLVVACGRGRAPAPGRAGGPAAPGTGPAVQRNTQLPTFDATPLYRQMGMLARGLPFPVLGRAAFVASPSPDTTHVVVALTFSNTALAFARESDNRFRANYTVTVALAQENVEVARGEASEELLVGTYRETTRSDESIVHQEILDVAPGRYTLTVAIRDEGSQRSAQEQMTIIVPRLGDGALSTPIPIVEVTPRESRTRYRTCSSMPVGWR